MTTWRTHGVDTVAALVEPKALKGLTRSVTAGPNEVAVITRDGEIADVFTEGKAATRGFVDLLRSMVSRGSPSPGLHRADIAIHPTVPAREPQEFS